MSLCWYLTMLYIYIYFSCFRRLERYGSFSSSFIDPFQFLVRFETVAVEVLEFTVVFGQSNPVSVIYVVFVEYDTVVGVLWEQLVQVVVMR